MTTDSSQKKHAWEVFNFTHKQINANSNSAEMPFLAIRLMNRHQHWWGCFHTLLLVHWCTWPGWGAETDRPYAPSKGVHSPLRIYKVKLKVALLPIVTWQQFLKTISNKRLPKKKPPLSQMLNNCPGCWGVLIIRKLRIRHFITYFVNFKLDVELNVEDSQCGPWWTCWVVHIHFRVFRALKWAQLHLSTVCL